MQNYLIKEFEFFNSIPDWKWSSFQSIRWFRIAHEFAQFAKSHNRLPAKRKGGQEKVYERWMQKQRLFYRQGTLSDDKIDLLNSISEWSWEKDLDAIWDRNFKYIQKYYLKHNKFPTQHSKNKIEQAAGKWINRQRNHYAQNELPPERIKKLESIKGWFWKEDLDSRWKNCLEEVVQFSKLHFKLPSPKSKDAYERKIGTWVETQFRNIRNNEMYASRLDIFNSTVQSIKEYIEMMQVNKSAA